MSLYQFLNEGYRAKPKMPFTGWIDRYFEGQYCGPHDLVSNRIHTYFQGLNTLQAALQQIKSIMRINLKDVVRDDLRAEIEKAQKHGFDFSLYTDCYTLLGKAVKEAKLLDDSTLKKFEDLMKEYVDYHTKLIDMGDKDEEQALKNLKEGRTLVYGSKFQHQEAIHNAIIFLCAKSEVWVYGQLAAIPGIKKTASYKKIVKYCKDLIDEMTPFARLIEYGMVHVV